MRLGRACTLVPKEAISGIHEIFRLAEFENEGKNQNPLTCRTTRHLHAPHSSPDPLYPVPHAHMSPEIGYRSVLPTLSAQINSQHFVFCLETAKTQLRAKASYLKQAVHVCKQCFNQHSHKHARTITNTYRCLRFKHLECIFRTPSSRDFHRTSGSLCPSHGDESRICPTSHGRLRPLGIKRS